MKKHHKIYHVLKRANLHKEHIKIYVLLGLIVLAIILIKSNQLIDLIHSTEPTNMGISYSPTYAKALGLNPKQTYTEILEDLQVKKVRLNAYWDEIELKPGKFNFTELDYYIDQATTHNASVMLAVGFKLPRWPECRAPKWLDVQNKQLRQERQAFMLEEVIKRYEQNPTIFAFQIENEPLFSYGICPTIDGNFLEKEVELARKLTRKPIILTDSGEMGLWIRPMQLSDYFGTTLYRTVESSYLGILPYPQRPWFYRVKSNIARSIFAPNNKGTWIVELQAEPWSPVFIADLPLNDQLSRFPLKQFKDNVSYAKKVGAQEVFLWGAEWWYYIKEQEHPEHWDYAKTLFKSN